MHPAAVGNHYAVLRLPGRDRTLQFADGRDCGRRRMPARIIRRVFRRPIRRSPIHRALWPLRLTLSSRTRDRGPLFRAMGIAHRLLEPDAASRPHLHRISRGSVTNEAAAVYRLHPPRIVYMVPRARIHRNEARAALGGSRAVLSSLRRTARVTVD